MAQKVRDFLRKQILQFGPMDIGSFMGSVLGLPEHGYYMRQDPLGALGDFTTSPEISQMFGEMIGAWLADCWIQLGSPKPFILCEGGPGRGTLMSDIIRSTQNIEGFIEAAHIHFIETSPVLRKAQKNTLLQFENLSSAPSWHDSLESLPQDMPLFFIANELLDALPFKQIVMTQEGWRERVVAHSDFGSCSLNKENEQSQDASQSPDLSGLSSSSEPSGFSELSGFSDSNEGSKTGSFIHSLKKYVPNLYESLQGDNKDGFYFAHKAFSAELEKVLPAICKEAQLGDIYEFSTPREEFVKTICTRLQAQGGLALFVDYGHENDVLNDSFRAFMGHKKIHVLEEIGSADLTSDVNFKAIGDVAKNNKSRVFGPVPQGVFLKNIGIETRAKILKSKLDKQGCDQIDSALSRLCDDESMGGCFLVMGFSYEDKLTPAGF